MGPSASVIAYLHDRHLKRKAEALNPFRVKGVRAVSRAVSSSQPSGFGCSRSSRSSAPASSSVVSSSFGSIGGSSYLDSEELSALLELEGGKRLLARKGPEKAGLGNGKADGNKAGKAKVSSGVGKASSSVGLALGNHNLQKPLIRERKSRRPTTGATGAGAVGTGSSGMLVSEENAPIRGGRAVPVTDPKKPDDLGKSNASPKNAALKTPIPLRDQGRKTTSPSKNATENFVDGRKTTSPSKNATENFVDARKTTSPSKNATENFVDGRKTTSPSKNDAVAAKKINTQLDNALVEQWREKSVVDRNRQMAELLEGRRRGKKILGGPSSLLVGFFEFLHSCLYNGGYDVSLGTINRPGQHSLLYF